MKILLGYSYYKSGVDVKQRIEDWLARMRVKGIHVDPFCLTIDPPNDPIYWPRLDVYWKLGDRRLIGLYERLLKKVAGYDVFINFNGINLHPEFVTKLPVYSVFSCFDDPESSSLLSQPVAKAYDLCMVGNIAEVPRYVEWGAKNSYYWPIGFKDTDYDSTIGTSQIAGNKRPIDVVFLGEKINQWRKDRIEEYASHFPQGAFYGKGWSSGFLPESKRLPMLRKSKIGINMHNSTGPVNLRTFYLPANGVMQICDNKSNLAKIFKLDKEAVGYNTVAEAVAKTNYYLVHEKERAQIALNGWKRALDEYNELAIFKLLISTIKKDKNFPKKRARNNYLRTHKYKTLPTFFVSEMIRIVRK